MKNKTDRFALSTGGNAVKHLINSQSANNNPRNSDNQNQPEMIRLAIALLAMAAFVLLLVGAEGVKTIFRRNVGKERINLFRMVLCALSLLGAATAAFILTNNPDDFIPNASSSDSYFVTGILLALLGFYVLVRGFRSWVWAKANNPSAYRGDSYLLNFLFRRGWSLRQVQNVAEPLVVIDLGILFCFYNLLGGLVLIVCGISVWCALLEERILGNADMQHTVARMNSKVKQQTDFHAVNAE